MAHDIEATLIGFVGIALLLLAFLLNLFKLMRSEVTSTWALILWAHRWHAIPHT
jgi:hypothetical protein